MTNYFILDGVVGALRRTDSTVFLRICHKDAFFNKKKNEWERREDWFSVAFFGKTADALEREAEPGDRIIVQGSMIEHPKNDPASRPRFNGKQFDLLLPYIDRGKKRLPIDAPLEEDLPEDEDE